MTIKLNWKLTIFSVFFLVLFVNLGFWQLDRAREKDQLLEDESRQIDTVYTAQQLLDLGEVQNGSQVQLQGHYLEQPVYFKDNVVLNGVVGFELLMVFHDELTQMNFLLNRGFVPMNGNRTTRPEYPLILDKSWSVEGKTYVQERVNINSQQLVDDIGIIQSTDPAVIKGLLPEPIYFQLIRLNESDPNALPRHWVLSNMSAEKHRGYAIQWFAMALAIFCAFGYFTVRTNTTHEQDKEQVSQ